MLVQDQLRCRVCGRIIDCTAAKLRLYRAIGSPECCGAPMDLPPARPAECRTAVRRFFRRGAQVGVRRARGDSAPSIGAAVTDVSAEGMGVVLAEPVTAGDELFVDFCRADGSTVVTVAGQVRWCRPTRGSMFAVGLRFARKLTLTELAELVH